MTERKVSARDIIMLNFGYQTGQELIDSGVQKFLYSAGGYDVEVVETICGYQIFTTQAYVISRLGYLDLQDFISNCKKVLESYEFVSKTDIRVVRGETLCIEICIWGISIRQFQKVQLEQLLKRIFQLQS